MKVIWKKLDLKLWDNVSFKHFLSLEIQLYYQKNTIWLGEFMPLSLQLVQVRIGGWENIPHW